MSNERVEYCRSVSAAAEGRARTAPAKRIDPKDTKALGEAFALARLPAVMGANPALVENVRARMVAGKPVGVLTPARTAEVRACVAAGR